jgi:glutathionylspermidine synthase
MALPAQVDRMSTEYLMWNAYVEGRLCALADPVRLPDRELAELIALSERFSRLLEKTIDRVLEEPALLEQYHFAPDVRSMIRSHPRPRPPVILARYDAFRTPQGWMFSEFNCDVPGGIHEGAALNDVILGDPTRFRVLPLLADALCRDRVKPTVAVCYASGYAEDLEQCQFLRRAWSRLGLRAILCNPENLVEAGHRLVVFGEPVDAVYRFFPGEWMAPLEGLGAILRAYRQGHVVMVNDFTALIAQSKRTMALWHERPDLFTGEERRLIAQHVPRTSVFRREELRRYRRERDRLVIKRQFGRVGEEVLMGHLCEPREWSDWLGWPASEPDQWIVQERFSNLPVEVGGEPLYACFGPYVVSGRFAGFYTRLAPDGFITYRALVAAVAPLEASPDPGARGGDRSGGAR